MSLKGSQFSTSLICNPKFQTNFLFCLFLSVVALPSTFAFISQCFCCSLQWYSLVSLDISATGVASLPPSFGGCANLRELFARGCRLNNLPPTMRTCKCVCLLLGY